LHVPAFRRVARARAGLARATVSCHVRRPALAPRRCLRRPLALACAAAPARDAGRRLGGGAVVQPVRRDALHAGPPHAVAVPRRRRRHLPRGRPGRTRRPGQAVPDAGRPRGQLGRGHRPDLPAPVLRPRAAGPAGAAAARSRAARAAPARTQLRRRPRARRDAGAAGGARLGRGGRPHRRQRAGPRRAGARDRAPRRARASRCHPRRTGARAAAPARRLARGAPGAAGDGGRDGRVLRAIRGALRAHVSRLVRRRAARVDRGAPRRARSTRCCKAGTRRRWTRSRAPPATRARATWCGASRPPGA
jgi:hypothetical protein